MRSNPFPQLLITADDTVDAYEEKQQELGINTAKKQKEMTPMRFTRKQVLSFFCVFALCPFCDSPSAGLTIAEIENTIKSNVSKVSSGSCTFSIENLRPKENLLGSAPLPDPQNQSPNTLVQTDEDVVLRGVGWFKWQDMNVAGYERNESLTAAQGSEVATIIRERLETVSDGLSKTVMGKYEFPMDAVEGDVDPMIAGDPIARYGVVGG